jgi:hypothetical protein
MPNVWLSGDVERIGTASTAADVITVHHLSPLPRIVLISSGFYRFYTFIFDYF